MRCVTSGLTVEQSQVTRPGLPPVRMPARAEIRLGHDRVVGQGGEEDGDAGGHLARTAACTMIPAWLAVRVVAAGSTSNTWTE